MGTLLFNFSLNSNIDYLLFDSYAEFTDQKFQHREEGWSFCCHYTDLLHTDEFNRTFEKISQLCDEIINPHKFDQIEDVIQDDFIIINGTSVGMLSNESPIKKDLLSQSQIVIDTIYTPLKTKLLCDSERSGATILNGLDMFIYQALASQDLWIGEPITSKVDVSALRNHLINVLQFR